MLLYSIILCLKNSNGLIKWFVLQVVTGFNAILYGKQIYLKKIIGKGLGKAGRGWERLKALGIVLISNCAHFQLFGNVSQKCPASPNN